MSRLPDVRPTWADAIAAIKVGQQPLMDMIEYLVAERTGLLADSRHRDAKYGAEQWCDTCIALDALELPRRDYADVPSGVAAPTDPGETT